MASTAVSASSSTAAASTQPLVLPSPDIRTEGPLIHSRYVERANLFDALEKKFASLQSLILQRASASSSSSSVSSSSVASDSDLFQCYAGLEREFSTLDSALSKHSAFYSSSVESFRLLQHRQSSTLSSKSSQSSDLSLLQSEFSAAQEERSRAEEYALLVALINAFPSREKTKTQQEILNREIEEIEAQVEKVKAEMEEKKKACTLFLHACAQINEMNNISNVNATHSNSHSNSNSSSNNSNIALNGLMNGMKNDANTNSTAMQQ